MWLVPLEGQRFRSRVTQSIVSGVLTYDNGMFSSESAAMAVKFKDEKTFVFDVFDVFVLWTS